MTAIHWILIASNTIIVIGGTRTNTSDSSFSNYQSRLHISGIYRAVGQTCFLVINIGLGWFLWISKNQDNVDGTISTRLVKVFRVPSDYGLQDGHVPRRGIHPTLWILIAAWPLLLVRGIFGLLQSQVRLINYADVGAYQGDGKGGIGFKKEFLVLEGVCAILMEWGACSLLCGSMFTREKEVRREHGADKSREIGMEDMRSGEKSMGRADARDVEIIREE
jgi:hypothetical protein